MKKPKPPNKYNRDDLQRAFNEGAQLGWMRCGVYHIDIDFEGRPEERAEVERRFPLSPPKKQRKK